MFCNNCGKELKEGVLFCNECGTKVKNTETITEEVIEPVAETQANVQAQTVQAEPAVKAEGVGFGQACRLFFKNYFDFKGRATRSEFWWAFLFCMLINLTYIGALVTIIGTLSLWVRRLHDIGKSWVWLLMGLIPYAGAIILIVYACKDSDGSNQWGPATK